MERFSDDGSLVVFVGLALVPAHNGAFGALHREIRRCTFFLALHAAEAGEVLVLPAAFASVFAVAEALAAHAEDGALEVVVVFVGAVAADAVAVEHLLHLIKGGAVDDRFVASLALDAVVGDDSGVVVVSEHPVDHAARHRFAWAPVAAARAQADALEDVGDARDGVIAGRGEIGCELDMRDPLIVNGYCGNLASVDVFTDVQVANAGDADSAAVEELAFEADLDLLPIVTRTKGVDSGHDREQQEPLRAVVNWLAGGGQLCAVALDLSEQPEGVGLLAGDP